MTMNDIKKIFDLRRQKKFDEIYELYGKNVYLMMTPDDYKDMDIDKLLKEKKYFALYEKYGEVYMKEMQKADIENEIGVCPRFVNFLFFENCKRKLKVVHKCAVAAVVSTTLCSSAVMSMMCAGCTDLVEDNSVTYESEIDDYNEEINEYATYINDLGLTDLEVIMKVMNDMQKNVYYNDTPSDYDIRGYFRLALYYDGYGVCRNMADDFTARMNAINPDYEACNLTVYMNGAEINNVLGLEDTVYYGTDTPSDFVSSLRSNHMVSCIKIKDENALLIVDPTNPSIGVLKNGKIYMLSDKISDGLDIKPLGHIKYGIDSVNDSTGKILESYLTNGDIDVLKEKYGIKAQNEALERILDYDTDNYRAKFNR